MPENVRAAFVVVAKAAKLSLQMTFLVSAERVCGMARTLGKLFGLLNARHRPPVSASELVARLWHVVLEHNGHKATPRVPTERHVVAVATSFDGLPYRQPAAAAKQQKKAGLKWKSAEAAVGADQSAHPPPRRARLSNPDDLEEVEDQYQQLEPEPEPEPERDEAGPGIIRAMPEGDRFIYWL